LGSALSKLKLFNRPGFETPNYTSKNENTHIKTQKQDFYLKHGKN